MLLWHDWSFLFFLFLFFYLFYPSCVSQSVSLKSSFCLSAGAFFSSSDSRGSLGIIRTHLNKSLLSQTSHVLLHRRNWDCVTPKDRHAKSIVQYPGKGSWLSAFWQTLKQADMPRGCCTVTRLPWMLGSLYSQAGTAPVGGCHGCTASGGDVEVCPF